MKMTMPTYQGPTEVTVWKTATPGLIVHKTIAANGWTITHEPSRRVLATNFPNRTSAREYARRFGQVQDFTEPDPVKLQRAAIQNQGVLEIMREIRESKAGRL